MNFALKVYTDYFLLMYISSTFFKVYMIFYDTNGYFKYFPQNIYYKFTLEIFISANLIGHYSIPNNS